ncbi:MAG TPA: pectinesterase family protein [Chitinophagaceae bacterium]|nr:pectinesterase family protein [Chitinophagaceae bacterium]
MKLATPIPRYRLFLLLILIMTCQIPLWAQLVSFPGAEGAGRFTSGGRGTVSAPTTVFEVTNLNDDNNPGSFRYALSQPATHRTVVFRVSGTIHLSSSLNIRSNTTIAGQTAPGDGICIADKPLTVNGDNIIVRYIRVRLGDRLQQATNGNDDALSGTGRKHIMIDHCTMSWSNDEAFTIYDGDSTTLQWNLISEPLNYSYHDEGTGIQNHGYGGIWGGRRTSAHHNLVVHCVGRNPRFAGSRNLSPFTPGQENLDFRNNVIYNWGSYSVNGGEGGNYNVVNNYYKYGPSTGTGNSSGVPVRYMIINPGQQTTAPVMPYGKYYMTGNFVDGSTAITNNNWSGAAMNGGSLADTSQSKVLTPFDIAPVTTQPATEAYEWVLQYAGASFRRDTLDQRIANDVRNRTGRIIDVQGGYPHGTPYANTVNAWPALQSLPAPADDDHDGMPNSWETANGLNPADASDRGLFAANGYTNLENYLNSIVSVPAITGSVNSLNAFSQTVGAASTTQTYTISGTNLSAPITITPPPGFQVSADGGSNWFSNGSPLSLSTSGANVAPKQISVRLNAVTAGSYAGNIVHSSTGAASMNIAVTGTAVGSNLPPGTNAIVAKDGSGHFTSIQAAINAAPTGLTAPYIIYIKNGKYTEKVSIPSNKPFIQLIGESAAYTIIAWGDGASTPLPGGGTVGTFNSYTLYIAANDCALLNLTIQNTFGDGSQAVALRVDADRVIVKSCRILGNQDTMLNNANAGLKQYFRNCYIDGNVDYIFGSARVILDSCVIYSKDRATAGNSYLTAANTQAGQAYGYVFRNCILPPNLGVTNYFLGRPWQNSTGASPVANNKTVFINSIMSTSVLPAGWSTWDAGTNTSLIYYGEYKSKNFDGSLVNTSSRVPWSYQLTDAEAATYSDASLFGGWDPCSAGAAFCASRAPEIAVTNFRAKKVASTIVFDWNISWAMSQVKFELYRSAVRTGTYVKVGETLAQNDTTYNFQLTDAIPPIGSAYYYYVASSLPGFVSHITDTLQVSSIQTITVTGSLNPFVQNYGTPSGAQTFTARGENLSAPITITPPPQYEVSANAGASWFTNSNPLILTPVNNTVANTTISVRLNANSLGSYSGNIVLASTGAASVNVPVSGTCSIIPQPTSVVLQQWPLNLSNSDSAAVRSAGVAASTPSFNRLTISNGTTVSAIQAYTAVFGQAFAASTNGDGTWTTAAGGPGGNLSRAHYEQFTVTAQSGYSVRVDSVLFNAAFYNTSSNTRLAVVYSLSGFTSDSSNVSTTPGTFTSPITLANQTSGTTNRYNLAFNDANGVILNAGQTITFRFYYSCGSTSPGRYGFLKDVVVKGKATDLAAPTPALTTSGTVTAFTQLVGTPSASQNYTVSGNNLVGPVYVIAPANFEISNDGGSSWKNSTQPIIFNPAGSNLPATTIAVRLNASAIGAYNGNIQHLTTGTAPVNFAVSGNTVQSPTITLTGTLNSFTHNVGTASALQTYTVSGSNMQGNITVTPPAGFEVSADGTNWLTNSNPLVLLQSAGVVNATVSVRMNAVVAGSYSGNISHTATDAVTRNLAVSGTAISPPVLTVNGTLNQFIQVLPNPSPAQTYTVNGDFLVNNLQITAPARYQISADGGNSWSNTLTLVPASGTINATIHVRLNATGFGNYTGAILHSMTGITTISVPVDGYSVSDKKYNLFPNPVYRTLFFEHPVSAEKATIHFYNLLGVKIATYYALPGTAITTLDVFNLPQGIYLVEYLLGNEKIVMRVTKI